MKNINMISWNVNGLKSIDKKKAMSWLHEMNIDFLFLQETKLSEQNYNFNESAFTSKNSIDNIIYCPFCGVGKSYLSEDCEIITVKSNLLSEDALKILDHAVKFINDTEKAVKVLSKVDESIDRLRGQILFLLQIVGN